ncbi:MAG: M48 family metalloprotease [Panacagrimonas sp.]
MLRTCTIFLLALSLLGGAWAAARAQDVRFPSKPSAAPALSTSSTQDIDLPQMGEPADTALSPSQELQLGARVVAQLYAYEYLLEDAQLTEYLTAMGWRLAAASGAKPDHLEFFVVKDPRINAFALPGGYMGFNAGLITASGEESELAGVMAHELAHVTQRHIARSQAESGGLASIATWAAVLAAIIAGSADPEVILAALSLGQGVAYQRQVNFTRANELEADRIGIQTLAEAGYKAEGMAGFFQKLEQNSRLYGSGTPEFLRTHPVNTTRIAEARSRAALLPQSTAPDSIEYAFMKARTQVFASRQPSDAVDAFAARLSAGLDTPGHRYGLAFALHQLGQNARALETIKPVLEKYPRQPNLALLEAAIHIGAGDTPRGLESYQRTLALHPRLAPVILEYAEVLIAAGQPAKAREILLSHEQALGVRLDTYRLLSQAARDVDNDAEASYQMANYLFLRGDAGGALSQLDAGLRLAKLSTQERARLSARRAEVREALPRNYDPYRETPRRRR